MATIKVQLPNGGTMAFTNAGHRVTRTDVGCDLEVQVDGELQAFYPAGSWRYFTIENVK